MSLKLFHVVFVGCSTLLAFLVGGWAIAGGHTLAAVAAFFFGVLLNVYGVWFWRKIRTPEEERRRRRKLLTSVAVVWGVVSLAGPQTAEACSVCYGEAEGSMIDAARLGVWLLFGLILVMQVAFVAFFLFLKRQSKRHNGHVQPWWTDVRESLES